MTQTNEEIFHVLGLEKSISWKWLFYSKQSTVGSFHRVRTKKNYNLCGNTKKQWIAKAFLKKKKKKKELEESGPQTILQIYSHQNSMVMAQKEKYRPME